SALTTKLKEGTGEELKWWTLALERSCREHLEDLLFLAPWLNLAPDSVPPISGELGQLDQPPTLRQVSELHQTFGPELEAALKALTKDHLSPEREKKECSLVQWLNCLREASSRARERILLLQTLATQSAVLAQMDF